MELPKGRKFGEGSWAQKSGELILEYGAARVEKDS